jgi:hypothetical protein
MFEIDTGKAVLKNVNGRKEHHGEDLELACDLNIEVSSSSDILNCFNLDGERIQAAFWNDDGAPRFPTIEPIKFNVDFADARLGIRGSQEALPLMVLMPCKTSKFIATPKENGMVDVKFRVQCSPSEDEIARLFELMQEDVAISIEPINTELDLGVD